MSSEEGKKEASQMGDTAGARGPRKREARQESGKSWKGCSFARGRDGRSSVTDGENDGAVFYELFPFLSLQSETACRNDFAEFKSAN